jgi:hypothetical protein
MAINKNGYKYKNKKAELSRGSSCEVHADVTMHLNGACHVAECRVFGGSRRLTTFAAKTIKVTHLYLNFQLTCHDLGRPNGSVHGKQPSEHSRLVPELRRIEYSEHKCDTFGKSVVAVRRRSDCCHPKEQSSDLAAMFLEYRHANTNRNQIQLDE